MPNINRPTRRIDQKLPDSGGGAIIGAGGAPPAAPGIAVPKPPQNLRIISTVLLYSAVTPSAGATLAWSAPVGSQEPDAYTIQWATDAAFTSPTTRVASRGQLTAALDGLPVNTTIYARVAARIAGVEGDWSNTASATTPQDTTAPGVPTAVSVAFATDGTLEVRATPPASPNFKHIRVEVRNAANTVELDRSIFAGGLWAWSPERNRLQSGGSTWTTSVTVRLYAVSWGNVDSPVVSTAASSPAPATPTGLTTTWASDSGTAGATCLITWTAVPGLDYALSVDTVERAVPAGRYPYDLELNRSEHAGTPDPVLTLALVARNRIGQSSTAATATATNAAPPATTLTAFGGFSQVGLTIAASTAQDIRDYRVRVYRNSSLVRTLFFTDLRPSYVVEDGDGSYTFDVAARDVFGQIGTASAQTTATPITDLAGFVTTLRSGLTYSDSLGTAAATLAALKDGALATDVITYTASTPWRWTMADWGEEITTQTVELALSATASVYLGYSLDGSTWTWFHGTAPSGGRWQPASSTSTEATAQSGAQTLTAGTWRIDIPAPRRARYIRLGHRNTGAAYNLREFFPATLLRATYMEAESIKAVNIAAGAILADKIAAGALDAFTVTGATIRTNATATRIELSGSTLDVINAGVTRLRLDTTGLTTYDGSGNVVIQATTATNGELWAAAGRVRLTRTTGIIHVQPPNPGTYSPMDFLRNDGATAIGQLETAVSLVNQNSVGIRVYNTAGTADGGTFYVASDTVNLFGGLNLGAATGAAAGSLNMRTAGNTIALIETSSTADVAQTRYLAPGRQFNVGTSGSAAGAPFANAWYVVDATAAVARLIIPGTGEVRVLNGLDLDAITAPSSSPSSGARLYVDSADGDLKVRFSNGVIKTIATN